MKYSRIIALFLTLLMVCSVFSGCFKKTTITVETIGGDASDVTPGDDNNYVPGGDDTSSTPDTDPDDGNNYVPGGDDDDTSSTPSTDPDEEEEENVVTGYEGSDRTVVVDLNKVVNTKFLGVGGNIVPYGYMPSNIAEGYNEAYYALDAQRLKTIGVDIVRFWIQVDWFEKQKGVYDFNTPEMFACEKYIEALQKAGCDVQVTFSWKVGDAAIPWYSIPGLDDTDKRVSAPHDIEHFGTECVVLFKYLRETCGYTNVKHITFGNEPNGSWDWETLGYQPAYYASVVESVDKAFKAAGMRDEIKIWAAEASSGSFPTWLSYLGKECAECIDVWSIHQSGHTNDTLDQWIDQINSYAERPLFISEYQEGHIADYYEGANAGHVIVGSQNGFAGFTTWDFWGVKHMSPTDTGAWEMEDHMTDGDMKPMFVFHNHFTERVVPGTLSFHYYTLGTCAKWMEQDNEVLKTTVTLSNNDMRATTIKNPDGTLTVIVEVKNSDKARELTIDFGKNLNQTFTRHVFLEKNYPETYEYNVGPIDVDSMNTPNGFLPKGDKTFKVGQKLVDTDIPKNDYAIIVYTTVPTETQIGFHEYDDVHASSVPVTVEQGASYQVKGYIYEGKAGEEIVYSIANPGEAKQGTISASGLYTADANAVKGDVVAVRAAIKGDPNNYKILLIRIAE